MVGWGTYEVFDSVGPLDGRSEESTERSYERAKQTQNERMELYGSQCDVR